MTTSLEEVITLYARDLMNQHGLHDWDIHWGENDNEAGRCYFEAQVISFNRKYLLDTAAHNIRDTILHEIAHALVRPNDNHDKEWWSKFKEIGGDGWWGRNDGSVTYSKPDFG